MSSRIIEEEPHGIEPFDIDGSSPSEMALRASEEKYRTLFEAIDEGLAIAEVILDDADEGVDYRILEANARFEQLTGMSRLEFLSGKTVRELIPSAGYAWARTLGRVAVRGESLRFECHSKTTDRWFEVYVFRVGDPSLRRVASLYNDISTRRRAEEALRDSEKIQAYLLKLSDVLRPIADPIDIMSAAPEVLARELSVSVAGYVEMSKDGDSIVVGGQYADGRMPALKGPCRLSEFGEGFAPALAAGEEIFISDVYVDPRGPAGGSEKTRGFKIRSVAGIPLIKDGRLVAFFYATHFEKRAWETWEQEIIRQTAERTWASVERARAESAQRASEEKYRALFNLIDQGFAVIEVLYDESGAPCNLRFAETNPAFEKLTGLINPIGKTSRELIPHLEDSCLLAYAAVVETGESIRFESYSHDFDRWLDIFASRVGGEGSHLVNVVVDDITDRKQAEAALRENEERSRLFFENVHEYALVRLDKELRFESWNPGAERIFGYSSQEVLGQPFSLLLSEEDRSAGIPCLEFVNIEKNERTEDARWLIHKDGRRIWTRWVTEPIRNKDGQVSGLAKVLRDETERLRSETSLRESEKLAVVGRMASSIAHEINNPLEAVTNLIYLARNCEISSEASALLQQAEHELSRVSHIATATLHFHRQASEPAEVDVEEILESTLLLHEGRLRATNVVTHRRYSGHPTIYCLANEIRQVFANLVSNAIDAMSKNSGPRRLIVRIVKAVDRKSGETGVRVMIADTGSGIQESAREHIFEPFFTTKSATGTGLGLWISAESVRKHQGTLRFRSRTPERYRGTVFSVFLGRGPGN